MHASTDAHLWKLDYVYVHIHKCAYTKSDFHKCSFMDDNFSICAFTEGRISYMRASVYAHLWKLDFIYVHIQKHAYMEADFCEMCI
jgi:hypothetical protein